MPDASNPAPDGATLDDATRRRYATPGAAGRYVSEMGHPIARVITAGEVHAVRRAVRSLGGVEDVWLDVAGGSGRLAGTVGGARVALDVSAAMLAADPSGDPAVLADATALPLADCAVSITVVLRLLHRCSDAVLVAVLAEGLRTSRRGVVVSDAVPAPSWRRGLRRGLHRSPHDGSRPRAHLQQLVAEAGGRIIADLDVLPLLSGGHVVAVQRA